MQPRGFSPHDGPFGADLHPRDSVKRALLRLASNLGGCKADDLHGPDLLGVRSIPAVAQGLRCCPATSYRSWSAVSLAGAVLRGADCADVLRSGPGWTACKPFDCGGRDCSWTVFPQGLQHRKQRVLWFRQVTPRLRLGTASMRGFVGGTPGLFCLMRAGCTAAPALLPGKCRVHA